MTKYERAAKIADDILSLTKEHQNIIFKIIKSFKVARFAENLELDSATTKKINEIVKEVDVNDDE